MDRCDSDCLFMPLHIALTENYYYLLVQVYLAIDNETGREWAVKFINIRNAAVTSKLTLTAILKEAEIMKNLSHPYIVNLEDVFMDETNVYLVMELLSGDPACTPAVFALSLIFPLVRQAAIFLIEWLKSASIRKMR